MHGLTDLALIWVAVLIAIVVARRLRLTPVLMFLFMGFVLVNSGLLPTESNAFVQGFADLGIIVIMFALGFEESTSNFLLSIRKSWGIALFGALAPFFTTYLIADYFWADRNLALMCGLAMTATAVSLTMVSLKSEGLGSSPVATRIMTSAVLDDIGSLAMVAILVQIATGGTAPDLAGIALILGKVVVFFVLITIVGAWVFPHQATGWRRRMPALFAWISARQLLAIGGGGHSPLVVLMLALFAGVTAHCFGFHPAIGAYMAGLILKEEYFDRRSERDSYLDTVKIVDSIAYSWIGPVFFVTLGGKLIFDWDIFVSVIPQTVALTVALFVAQVSSAGLAARYTSGMDWRASLMIGFGMLGRAELAFVVIDIAYVQNHIIHTEAFYTLMFTAFWLNVCVPLTIRWWKPHYVARTGSAAPQSQADPSD